MKKERKIVLAKKHGYAWLWLILGVVLTVLAIFLLVSSDLDFVSILAVIVGPSVIIAAIIHMCKPSEIIYQKGSRLYFYYYDKFISCELSDITNVEEIQIESRYRPYRYYSYGQIRITVSCVGEYLIRGVADIASVKTQILYAVFKAKEEKTNNSNIQIDEQKTVQND